MSDKNHEFSIKLEGIDLSKEASDRIQTGINNLLIQELAGSGAGKGSDPDDNFCGVFIPRKWIGRQVLVANLERLAEISRTAGNISFIAPASLMER